MKYFLLFLSLSVLQLAAQESKVLPSPQEIEVGSNSKRFNSNSVIRYQADLESEADYLHSTIEAKSGLDLRTTPIPLRIISGAVGGPMSDMDIVLTLDPGLAGSEAYTITTFSNSVTISGSDAAGVFYGIQTLLQALDRDGGDLSLFAMSVSDAPAFRHRGLLLDACRHFWSVEVTKKCIDLLARYKMNVLHWHLTEDQGWRIEIEAYPRLTEVGAWRTESDGSRYGGYYTKKEIREVVAYAAARHITVIPEIELPGHSLAALASYPHLGCTGGPYEVSPEWGVFKDIYCAGSDSTFIFLENVLDEVLDLFPSRYIHIGGDESPKYRWENCARGQRRMRAHGLHDEHELQSWFISRIQSYLASHDRRLIGWDEILEGGLPQGSTVQSWRGMDGAISAAMSGNYAIMSPTSHCYLDYGLESIDLPKIWSFDPIPPGLSAEEASFIIGGECNLWTEHITDEETLDRQLMPRMIGMAEVLWRGPMSGSEATTEFQKEQAYTDFVTKLRSHYPALEAMGVDFGFERVPLALSSAVVPKGVLLLREDLLDDLQATYATASDRMRSDIPTLPDSLLVTADSEISIHISQNGHAYPKVYQVSIAVHKGLGQRVTADQVYSPHYTAGGLDGLSDGFLGTLDFRDGHWQGYSGSSVRLEVDLGRPRPLTRVGANFYQYNNAWIFPPKAIELSLSQDGKTYSDVIRIDFDGDMRDRSKSIHSMMASLGAASAQHIRLDLISMGPLPEWHDAAGSDSWIFIDELIIR